ncbi:hypothetical protein D3C78_1560420 [compost metagenome]
MTSRNSASCLASRLKSWTTRMPLRFSAMKALIRAKRVRTSRKAMRALLRKIQTAIATRGVTVKTNMARPACRRSMTTATPTISTRSLKRLTRTEVYISLRASVSFVTRVTNRPAGCRSKKLRLMPCRWSKTSCRMVLMIDWPVFCRRTASP